MQKNKRYVVLTAALILSLALGIIYAWSIIKEAIETSVKMNSNTGFNWDISALNDPYSIAVLVFSLTMIFAGKMQDKLGPRITIYIGGILISSGLFIMAFSTSYVLWIIGFGIFAGSGIGFCYSAITPVIIKWFSPEKTGLVTGVVVAGFGLSSVYLAPLFTYLFEHYGFGNAILYYGIGFSIILFSAAFFLKNPENTLLEEKKNISAEENNYSLKDILKHFDFYRLWIIYFIGAGAGLMVISFITEMVKKGLGKQAFWGVIIIALGNAAGRVISGIMSDKIGKMKTLIMFIFLQTLLMFTAAFVINVENVNVFLLLLIATFIGFSYGSNLTIFPTITKEKWGMKNFGANYGILFSAWGIGGFILSRISQMLKAQTGSLHWSFILAGSLLIVALILAFTGSINTQKNKKHKNLKHKNLKHKKV